MIWKPLLYTLHMNKRVLYLNLRRDVLLTRNLPLPIPSKTTDQLVLTPSLNEAVQFSHNELNIHELIEKAPSLTTFIESNSNINQDNLLEVSMLVMKYKSETKLYTACQRILTPVQFVVLTTEYVKNLCQEYSGFQKADFQTKQESFFDSFSVNKVIEQNAIIPKYLLNEQNKAPFFECASAISRLFFIINLDVVSQDQLIYQCFEQAFTADNRAPPLSCLTKLMLHKENAIHVLTHQDQHPDHDIMCFIYIVLIEKLLAAGRCGIELRDFVIQLMETIHKTDNALQLLEPLFSYHIVQNMTATVMDTASLQILQMVSCIYETYFTPEILRHVIKCMSSIDQNVQNYAATILANVCQSQDMVGVIIEIKVELSRKVVKLIRNSLKISESTAQQLFNIVIRLGDYEEMTDLFRNEEFYGALQTAEENGNIQDEISVFMREWQQGSW